YGMPELGSILDVMLADRSYTLDPAAREYALKLIEAEKTKHKESFGNGRTVRNLVEKAEKIMAKRLDDIGALKPSAFLEGDEGKIRALLTTMTLDDVKGVNLEGINDKPERVPGFGMPKVAPANDSSNVRAPAPAEAFPQVATARKAPPAPGSRP